MDNLKNQNEDLNQQENLKNLNQENENQKRVEYVNDLNNSKNVISLEEFIEEKQIKRHKFENELSTLFNKKDNKFHCIDLTDENNNLQYIHENTKSIKPPPLNLYLKVNLDTLYKGGVIVLKYKVTRICPECKGNFKDCDCCNKTGLISKIKEIFIKIPKNTKFNKRFVVKERGNQYLQYLGIGDLVIEFKNLGWKIVNQKDLLYQYYVEPNKIKNDNFLKIPYFDKEPLLVNKPQGVRHKDKLFVKNKGWWHGSDRGDAIIQLIDITKEYPWANFDKFLKWVIGLLIIACVIFYFKN